MTSLYITGTIEQKLIEEVQDALDTDTLKIDVYINSHGGCAVTGLAVYDMLSEDPRVHIHVRGLAASSAAVIALGSNHLTLNENAEIMYHKCSIRVGHANENEATESIALLRRTDKVIRKLIEDFLTADELAHFDNGKDVWLSSKQMKKRLK